MIYYVIPARAGSKGLPFKNRKLFQYTLNNIPKKCYKSLYVSTDDPYIIDLCKNLDINYLIRSSQNSNDTASTKSVMKETVQKLSLNKDDIIILLYLTYPERKWDIVEKAKEIFLQNNLKSLLCKKTPKTNPFLCFLEDDGNIGRQIIKHDYYRRQDYPKCFELSFYVCIFLVDELKNLSSNMYNYDTYFFRLEDHIDIDSIKDWKRFLNTNDIYNS